MIPGASAPIRHPSYVDLNTIVGSQTVPEALVTAKIDVDLSSVLCLSTSMASWTGDSVQRIADDIRAADARRDAARSWRQFAFTMLSTKGKLEWRAIAARVMGIADGLNRQFKTNPRRQTKCSFENDILILDKAAPPMAKVEARPLFDAGVVYLGIVTRATHGSKPSRLVTQLGLTYEEDGHIHITVDDNEVSDVEEFFFAPIREAVTKSE
jgi:hypothetical protein